MVKLAPGEMSKIAPLFFGVEETMVWSCLQGMMGEAWADQREIPAAARILIGDFLFLGGDSETAGAAELVGSLPASPRPFCLMIPNGEGWAALIEAVYGERAERLTRYAFEKNTAFDRERLEQLRSSLPDGCRIAPFDTALCRSSFENEWSRDFCSNFRGADDFLSRGIGSAVLFGSELVGGASSYTVYNGGIEIEIDVREDFRRKGIGAACAADLILRCLKKGIDPSWDAANPVSAALAQKLGYRLKGEYQAYSVLL